MSRINKVAFKIKGGATQIKNFGGIESKYDGEKLTSANKKEIRAIVADQYKCKESDVLFSDEFEAPKPAEEKVETGKSDETGKGKEIGSGK